jgi:hypothetical protein
MLVIVLRDPEAGGQQRFYGKVVALKKGRPARPHRLALHSPERPAADSAGRDSRAEPGRRHLCDCCNKGGECALDRCRQCENGRRLFGHVRESNKRLGRSRLRFTRPSSHSLDASSGGPGLLLSPFWEGLAMPRQSGPARSLSKGLNPLKLRRILRCFVPESRLFRGISAQFES